MSRLQSHKKSQSTSALSTIASGSNEKPSSRLRRSQHPTRTLGRVEEGELNSASLSKLPGLSTPGRSVGMKDGRRERVVGTMEDVGGWLNDVQSLRSSDRRRLAALKGMEKMLVDFCRADKHSSRSSPSLEELVDLQIYNALLSLLTRHAQTLTQRHSAQATNDEIWVTLVRELIVIISLLQGLCLVSRSCKAAVAESWIVELLIDLLLLLRAQPPPIPQSPRNGGAVSQEKPIAYNILELLFCILVDSPANARMFERLSGLEGVVRVLKGTGVSKDVRMKCIEFLYFYLLPEQSAPQRNTSNASSSSSSSTESQLYPPSPLSSSTGSDRSRDAGRLSPSPSSAPPKSPGRSKWADLDVPFIPQTPRKPPQPNLGYLTPSTNRRASSTSVTPSLPTVPASPQGVPASPSSRYLTVDGESASAASGHNRQWSRGTEGEPNAGLGVGLPRNPRPAVQPSPSSRRLSSRAENQPQVSHPRPPQEDINAGLGLGIPRSSSAAKGLSRSASKRDVTAIHISDTPSFADPFASTSESRSSSGSSTVLASPRSITRSDTQPSFTIIQSSPPVPHTVSRQVSVRRVSNSPLVQSMTPHSPTSPQIPPSPQPTKMAHSRTQSHLSSLGGEMPPPSPREAKIRHSRRQSHLSGLNLPMAPPPPVIAPPPVPPILSDYDNKLKPLPPASPQTANPSRTPSKAKRAFPAELTKGLPPSTSSPNLNGNSPLMASRRIPSDRKVVPGLRAGGKELRSVEEKKELLGSWLGNVDALVQGVEKVSFWGSVGAKRS